MVKHKINLRATQNAWKFRSYCFSLHQFAFNNNVSRLYCYLHTWYCNVAEASALYIFKKISIYILLHFHFILSL
jgi:hypothetical protein